MKAITYSTYGTPDVLQLQDIPIPAPRNKQVLVKVSALSINSWDYDMLTGKPFEYRFFSGLFGPKHNLLHGCDIVGQVEAVGSGVTRFKPGDYVFGDLGEKGWGAFAEYVCVDENSLFPKPDSLPLEDAACLSHGGNLAVQGLIDFGNIQSGQKVLINGGGGSTGTLAIQIAKTYDIELTAVDRPEKLDLMRSLGADHVIDFTNEDFTTQGNQYDLIFDVKTNRPMSHYRRALKFRGIYITVGGKTSRILQLLFFGKRYANNTMHMVGYKPNKDIPYLIKLYEAGKLKPVIDRAYPLVQTADAFRFFGEGTFKGKIVVTIDEKKLI